jgi:flagellar hook-length control protein FliK
MSMQNIQFDPRITTDLQIDWRRPDSGQTADLFADLLKRRFDTDQRDVSPRRREELADRLSGRPPRLVIAQAKTLRGEAKEVDTEDRRLPDRGDGAQTEAMEQAAAPEEAAATTETPAEEGTSDLAAGDEAAATGDQPAQASDQADTIVPETPIVVPIQSSSEPAAGSESVAPDVTAIPAELVLGEDGEILSPEQTDQAADAAEGESESGVTTEQQAAAAMIESGMVDVAAALSTGAAAPAPGETSSPVAAAAQLIAASTAPVDEKQPNLQIFQVPAPFGEEAAVPQPAHARPDRSSMDIKLRPGTTPQGRPGASDSASNAASPAQSAPPHQASLAQPGAGLGEFGTADEPFTHPFETDGSGPGWMLNLAQGAANRRAEFIAHLRQHLQNLPAHEQMAVHIQRAVREGTGRLSVQLSPAELGRIHVKLEIDEDKRVTAAVTVERPSTLELLQRDVRGLERALHNAGLMMEGGDLSFSLGHGSDQEFAQDLSQSGASATNGLASGAESEVEQPTEPATQVMDTAAGVLNLQV